MIVEHIEKIVGVVKICKDNLFMSEITDMQELEYWEERLEQLQEPYALTYKLKKGAIAYNIYLSSRRKGGAFKC